MKPVSPPDEADRPKGLPRYHALDLSLADARTNCAREHAMATVTLKSGVQLHGILKESVQEGVVRMNVGQGWCSILKDEIAAVSVIPRDC